MVRVSIQLPLGNREATYALDQTPGSQMLEHSLPVFARLSGIEKIHVLLAHRRRSGHRTSDDTRWGGGCTCDSVVHHYYLPSSANEDRRRGRWTTAPVAYKWHCATIQSVR